MAPNTNNVSLFISAGRPDQFPTRPTPQIAISGRSNVGKSSLINAIFGRKSLARVSSTPGKTITVNFYDVDGAFFLSICPDTVTRSVQPRSRRGGRPSSTVIFQKPSH